ncbi:MAG: hypothetical protein QGF67_15750 [Lentisphaeria bacterium]|jgi:hypothetical protein|nr:hypothetical protein [Lentisphaeria bacterium]MDP7742894.1 hypothetical protein [Lentisphaeria bacterium]
MPSVGEIATAVAFRHGGYAAIVPTAVAIIVEENQFRIHEMIAVNVERIGKITGR